MSEKIIAACGHDCGACPRHLPKTEDELKRTAELWMRIGYRDHVASAEEMACAGCMPENWCRYGVVGCVAERGVAHCGRCPEYPCPKIEACFRATEAFRPGCEAACAPEELEALQRAFFEKRENLEGDARR